MEQILIRNLPIGTKAALSARARLHQTSVEAEARALLTEALQDPPVTLVDVLRMAEGVGIEFEPDRLGLAGRAAEL